jgi:hypothetical protein
LWPAIVLPHCAPGYGSQSSPRPRSQAAGLRSSIRTVAAPELDPQRAGDWASGYDVGEPATTLSSTGVTLRMKWPHLQADLAFGARLIHPSFVEQQHGSRQDHGIHAQLSSAP